MKKRVLLVEDNPAAMDVMQKELEFLGYSVLLATDGEQEDGVSKKSKI